MFTHHLHCLPRVLALRVHLITMNLDYLPWSGWDCVVVRHVKIAQPRLEKHSTVDQNDLGKQFRHLWSKLESLVLMTLLRKVVLK